ncbi:MAG: adenine deaminase [Prolixibacteraceae bacterium]|jgi:adenine deaminase|nr:adenine deaminase [Prolixibacteraceae bacterium]
MKSVEGNIVDLISRSIFKGRIHYSNKIESIEKDSTIVSEKYILPGLVDAHVHIESSMLSPLEYSKIALKHGVIASVTDPHEIANVCGMKGVRFMIENASLTPMKLSFGAPSCVPATPFETSGALLDSSNIETLFKQKECSHLSEMMNFPGVIYNDKEVHTKIEIAHKYNKVIDGHAPLLNGYDLRKYVKAGITTDHECTSIHEALEKISLGMKIMLRESSASIDFQNLISLINSHSDKVMFCTDDCHPDDLEKSYINGLVKRAIDQKYDIFDILTASTLTAKSHYKLNIGLLQISDCADFIVVDDLENFTVISTVIDGVEVFDGSTVLIDESNLSLINNFLVNTITDVDLQVRRSSSSINVIEVIPDSLLTKKYKYEINISDDFIHSNIEDDILKIVVLNRYVKAKASVGFIKGFTLKKGAIAGTIAHDSHNIVAVGVDDESILKAIQEVQKNKGALVVVDGEESHLLSLPIAGLMSDKDGAFVSKRYAELSQHAIRLGCCLNAPFMTLAFMSLLVIPELKLGDQGLFDVNKFEFIDLQN